MMGENKKERYNEMCDCWGADRKGYLELRTCWGESMNRGYRAWFRSDLTVRYNCNGRDQGVLPRSTDELGDSKIIIRSTTRYGGVLGSIGDHQFWYFLTDPGGPARDLQM